MRELVRHVTWPEWRHHPWRQFAALIAITLGVALAFSVQLINQSALSEFSAAVRAVNGEPDFEVRAQREGFDEAMYERIARHPQVQAASPVVEVDATACAAAREDMAAACERVPVRVLGLDALSVASLSPALTPEPNDDAPRLALVDPGAAFLNAQARVQLPGTTLRLLTPQGPRTWAVQGSVAAPGPALVVMDIAGAQAAFNMLGRLSRIDVRLAPGADRAQVWRELALPPGLQAIVPGDNAQRVSNLSRAYRVNLTVLALVALFTGAFLVFSILSLSVAQRQPQFALLGVLGLSARERLRLVLAESALLGLVGSLAGLALGAGLAAAALRLLAGDLGGGYFPGVTPTLQVHALDAVVYGALGVAASLLGGWLPARAAQRLAPAQALKGLSADATGSTRWLGPALLVASAALSLLPPIGGIAWGAYVSVACLLLGGIACVPASVGLLLKGVRPPAHAPTLLAVERARHRRQTATVAVAGVVASLSLSVALTVMVASFRDSVTQWLEVVLPADLYVRSGAGAAEGSTLPPALLRDVAALPGVDRVEGQRVTSVQLDARQPAVVLIARPVSDASRSVPLTGELVPLPPGETAAYVSEAMVTLYGAAPGTRLELPIGPGGTATLYVRGVWRDYARQHGAVLVDHADYLRLTGDVRINDAALWLTEGARLDTVQQALQRLGDAGGPAGAGLTIASPAEIRATSLRIFDRSFAVTYWLQAVAIAIGLFGIAASFSAQVLARRKEFGLLAHLGFTRRQVVGIVAAEGAVWTACGAVLGLVLGIVVSVVLVKVVNPQSFHWTMDLQLPGLRLALLCGAVVIAGTATAWLCARHAAGRQAVLAVKEDW